MKKIIVILVLTPIISIPLLSRADVSFLPIFNADIRGLYTSEYATAGINNSSWGGVGEVLFLPAVKFGKQDYLLPLLISNLYSQERVIEEDTFFIRRWANLGSLGYKHKFDETWETKISFESRYNFNIETLDESFGKGLYDYYDLGGSGILYYNLALGDHLVPQSIGFKYFKRTYPNYASLGAQSGLVNTEGGAIKDFYGMNPWVNLQLPVQSDLMAQITYNYLHKDFTDKLTYTSQGQLTTTKRADDVHNTSLGLTWLPSQEWVFGLSGTGQWQLSNMGNYDGTQFYFIENYYNFWSLGLNPSVTRQWTEWKTKIKPAVSLGTGILWRNYEDRIAQDSAGFYKSNQGKGSLYPAESDQEYSVSVSGRYPIDDHWAINASVSEFFTRSNMTFEQFLRYNYNIFNGTLGVSCQF